MLQGVEAGDWTLKWSLHLQATSHFGSTPAHSSSASRSSELLSPPNYRFHYAVAQVQLPLNQPLHLLLLHSGSRRTFCAPLPPGSGSAPSSGRSRRGLLPGLFFAKGRRRRAGWDWWLGLYFLNRSVMLKFYLSFISFVTLVSFSSESLKNLGSLHLNPSPVVKLQISL